MGIGWIIVGEMLVVFIVSIIVALIIRGMYSVCLNSRNDHIKETIEKCGGGCGCGGNCGSESKE